MCPICPICKVPVIIGLLIMLGSFFWWPSFLIGGFLIMLSDFFCDADGNLG